MGGADSIRIAGARTSAAIGLLLALALCMLFGSITDPGRTMATVAAADSVTIDEPDRSVGDEPTPDDPPLLALAMPSSSVDAPSATIRQNVGASRFSSPSVAGHRARGPPRG